MSAPAIGSRFEHDGTTWRVDAYLRRREIPPVDCYDPWAKILNDMRKKYPPRGFGPDNCPLEFCAAEDAEYVSAVGACGIIVRVSDVDVIGMVPWSEELLESERRTAASLIGQAVY